MCLNTAIFDIILKQDISVVWQYAINKTYKKKKQA